MRRWLFLPVLSLCCGLLAAQAASAQTYTVTDLGYFPGGDFSTALGIDEHGDATGWSGSAGPGGVPGEAFLYRDGKLINLGALGGQASVGYGIAHAKERDPWQWDERKKRVYVTGSANDAQGNTHAFLYDDHMLRDLGFLPGGTVSIGLAVNSSGEVAGFGDSGGGAVQPVLFKHGNVINLGTLGGVGGGEALGINDLGDVTGNADAPNDDSDAFLYHNGTMIDLGTLPGAVFSSGDAINNFLQVTGSSGLVPSRYEPPFSHAVLWSKGTVIDLGVLPTGVQSVGLGINARGQIVGESDILGPSNFGPPEYISHGFIYVNGQMYDLNDLIAANSGWVLGAASGINDRGQISGTGTINGETHGYLLTMDCSHANNKGCEQCKRGH